MTEENIVHEVTDEQLVVAIMKVINECDSDTLCMIAGEVLGGACYEDYMNDGWYYFEPNDMYAGAFDNLGRNQ
jgi:hypothetical protein